MESHRRRAEPDSVFALLSDVIADPKFEVSIGAYGAIGQFAREPRIFVEIADDRLIAATQTSSISLHRHPNLRPIAFEMLSSDPQGWNSAIALCLPERDARMVSSTGRSRVQRDSDAIFSADRETDRCDIDLGTVYADIGVRAVAGSFHALENHKAGEELLAELLDRDDSDWIFETAIGRIETRDKRRCHFIPQLLSSNDTHSKSAPVPAGFVVVGYAFPPNPRHLETEDGVTDHHSFQVLLDQFGITALTGFKRRVERALTIGAAVTRLEELLDHCGPPTRSEVHCIRVALRQRRWLRGGQRLPDWEEFFDRPLAESHSSTTAT